jgi:hypothetical protein
MEAAMNPHDIDPSLLPGEPLNDSLDDGFSARVDGDAQHQQQQAHEPAHTAPAQPQLSPKSPF